ncbi:MAG TPA: hypothetical protein VGF15_01565 [Solirubrobacteraceae bacterium]|jgi:hypothetical protein
MLSGDVIVAVRQASMKAVPGRGLLVRGLRLLIVIVVLCGSRTAVTGAVQERASLYASFSPDRLGASTTISFGFRLSTTEGVAPPPLRNIALRMPAGMNYTTTTLGLALCDPASLLSGGIEGCPANSRLGYGSALVEVPFGSGEAREVPELQAVSGPSSNGNLVVLFYADGKSPISAQLVFKGEVLPASGIFGSELAAAVPPVPTVPDGPDVSILSAHTTIGPSHLTYYKHVHGKLVPFTPQGVGVPERCPHGGFPFAAQFTFQDGNHVDASARVPCPRNRRTRH